MHDPFDIASDQALQGAKDAIDPRIARERLADLACEDGVHMGIELTAIHVLRHKPGRRCLIEFVGRSRTTGEEISLIGKVDAKNRQNLRFERQRALWNAGFQFDSIDGISVARPWGVVREWSMWLQEKVKGQTAWRALQSSAGPTIAKQIGYALTKLHDACLVLPSIHTIDDEMRILYDRLSQAADLAPHLAGRILRLGDACQEIVGEHVRGAHCPVHRDFYPDQMLIDGNRIVLVDFDLLCRGEAAIDIGNFRAHLWEHSLCYPLDTRSYTACDAALVNEYVRHRPAVTIASIDVYTVLSLTRHVFLCTKRFDPDSTMPRILDACERFLTSRITT